MKSIVWKSILSTLPILPALVFLIAGLVKASDPLLFLYELSDYNLRFALDAKAVLVLFLPAIEVLLGMPLLFRRSSVSRAPRSPPVTDSLRFPDLHLSRVAIR